MRSRLLAAALSLVTLAERAAVAQPASAASDEPAARAAQPDTGAPPRRRVLPLMADEARKRGVTLPLPFGVGAVYYHLDRAIEVTDVRVGRDGAPPASVSDFAQLSSSARVDNVNAKVDVWLLPFLNVYAIVGYIWNESDTRIDVALPPLVEGGPTRRRQLTVPTSLTGTVGGVGITAAGGYGPWFMTYDANFAQADLGFDDRFKAVVASIRAGWNGQAGARPVRAWLSVTDWNTFATATGTVDDPDGGTLDFEVDQGPAYRYTYGVGGHYALRPSIEFALDAGSDFHGGWYVALVPVFRF